jgi:hypothetical protein
VDSDPDSDPDRSATLFKSRYSIKETIKMVEFWHLQQTKRDIKKSISVYIRKFKAENKRISWLIAAFSKVKTKMPNI